MYDSLLQCVLQCALQCVAVYDGVSQCVAVCVAVYVAVYILHHAHVSHIDDAIQMMQSRVDDAIHVDDEIQC